MNDLISRQAAIDVCCSDCIMDCKAFYCKIVQEMIGLPSVQPEQKRGKWIERDKYLQYCSRCMYMIRGDASKDIIKEFRYCPNCGAKMNMEWE